MIAEGGQPVRPSSIPGIGQDNVRDPIEVPSGRARIGEGAKAVVVGSGMTGLETAEYLAARGSQVSVFEMAEEIGPRQYIQNLVDVLGRLRGLGVTLNPGHRLVAVEGGTVRFEHDGAPVVVEDVDAVVLSLGTRPVRDLVEGAERRFERVRVLGDSAATGRIR
jgi:NADPH-dependent 2,4-dienoyl-CoA reductase/sulfur reductase-like enzyme